MSPRRRIHVSVRVGYELARWLREAEEATGLSRSEMLRRALELGARELIRRAWSRSTPA